jgi:hypothetical protein
MKNNTLMIILTVIIIGIASFGKYVEINITESAINIVEKRLNPAPLLSHRFDYFGTTLKENFTSQKVNFENLKANKSEMLKVRNETSIMWEKYKLLAGEEEREIVERTDNNMKDVDQFVDMLIEKAETDPAYVNSIIEKGILFEKIDPILKDINYLTDLQTEVGTKQTNVMLELLKKFSNFMIGALSLAMIMLGSIIYSVLKKDEPIKSTKSKKTTTKTTKGKTPTKTPSKTSTKTPVTRPKKTIK